MACEPSHIVAEEDHGKRGAYLEYESKSQNFVNCTFLNKHCIQTGYDHLLRQFQKARFKTGKSRVISALVNVSNDIK